MRHHTVTNSAFASWALTQKDKPMLKWEDKPLLPYKASAIVADIATLLCIVALLVIAYLSGVALGGK